MSTEGFPEIKLTGGRVAPSIRRGAYRDQQFQVYILLLMVVSIRRNASPIAYSTTEKECELWNLAFYS
jgi:hypothetical protein